MKGHEPQRETGGFGWQVEFNELLAVCEHDADGVIRDCTTRFASMLGFSSAEELIGSDLFGFYINASDPAHLLSLLEVDAISEPVDICLRRADNLLIWVLQTANLHRRMGRQRVISNYVDITERKLAELLEAQRVDAEAMIARVVADEVMAQSDIGSIMRGFRTATSLPTVEENAAPAHLTLSPRELRVLVMTGHGRSLKEIATTLGISLKSVSTYRARVMAKLGVHTTADLVAYVVRSRLK